MYLGTWESVWEGWLLYVYTSTGTREDFRYRLVESQSIKFLGIHFYVFNLQFQPYLSATKCRVSAQQSRQYSTNRCQGPTAIPGIKLGLLR